MRPSALGVGAYKSGTTTVMEYMRRHPLISTPQFKELNWFNQGRWSHPSNSRDMTQHEYESHFQDGQARVEFSPMYQLKLKSIAEIYPNMPIILCVRNPIERMQSHIRMDLNPEATALDDDAIYDPYYNITVKDAKIAGMAALLRQGHYKSTIQEANELGMPILVIDFQDICHYQAKVWSRLCKFLGVPEAYVGGPIHALTTPKRNPNWTLPPELIPGLKKFFKESNAYMLKRFGIDLDSPV